MSFKKCENLVIFCITDYGHKTKIIKKCVDYQHKSSLWDKLHTFLSCTV